MASTATAYARTRGMVSFAPEMRLLTLEAVFFELRGELLVADLEDLRGAALVARRFLQRLLDLPLLHFGDDAPRRLAQRSREIDLRPGARVVRRLRDRG